MTIVGQLAAASSVNFALTQMIYAAVTIGSEGRFIASTRQILGLYLGINIALGILNSLPTKALHRISTTFGRIYLSLCTHTEGIVSLLQSRHDVCGDHSNSSRGEEEPCPFQFRMVIGNVCHS